MHAFSQYCIKYDLKVPTKCHAEFTWFLKKFLSNTHWVTVPALGAEYSSMPAH